MNQNLRKFLLPLAASALLGCLSLSADNSSDGMASQDMNGLNLDDGAAGYIIVSGIDCEQFPDEVVCRDVIYEGGGGYGGWGGWSGRGYRGHGHGDRGHRGHRGGGHREGGHQGGHDGGHKGRK